MGKSGDKNQMKGNMFRGQHLYTVDSKGRVSIPAKLRKQISPEANDSFVMTKGGAMCIDIYPMDQWNILEDKLKALNPFNNTHAKFIRMILQFATEDSLDAQSRIMIPPLLLDYAGIKKDVLVLGALKKIELWNPDVYEKYINESGETCDEIAQKVMTM